MIVVVVIPLTVVVTSLTMLLDEPPPAAPELPPADCDDEVDDVADVDEAADVEAVDDVDDVEDVADDDFAALDGGAVTAAVEDAIALIDMRTSPDGRSRALRRLRALFSPSTRRVRETGAASVKNTQQRSASRLPA